MDDLLSWLRQQLDEDERVAQATLSDNVRGNWRTVPAQRGIGLHEAVVDDHIGVRLASGPTRVNEHIARWDPSRVLAEVEAKREILDEVGSLGELADLDVESTAWLLGTLAQPYHDRPGWKPEWVITA